MAKDKSKKTTKKDIQELTDRVAVVNINDQFSTYPSYGLTPEKLAAILRDADQGDVFRQAELFTEMLEKDGHLMSLFGNIRIRIAGANYEIIPGSADKNDVDIAGEATKMISRIKGWKNHIGDLLDCASKGYSVCENIWLEKDGRLDIVEFKHIDQKKFRFGKISDMQSDLNEIRLVVDPRNVDSFRAILPESDLSTAATDGITLDVNPTFRKRFTVAIAKLRSGSPARAALLRTCAFLFLFKNYDIKWWVRFAEIQLGIRLGKYDPSQPEQLALLKKAIANLGNDSAAVISKESDIEFKELLQKAASFETYKDLKDFCNSEMTKAVLLHTAAVESTAGKLGNEKGAEDSLQNLYEFYASIIDEVVTDDELRAWVETNYGEQENYPSYKTQIEKGTNLLEHADLILKLQMAGKAISQKYVDQKFGIPSPDPNDPDDKALEPLKQNTQLVTARNEIVFGDSKKKLLTKN